jgi:NAD(P)-dependent dehydrogenase (short-subunit alcohol dehydrogenase family)
MGVIRDIVNAVLYLESAAFVTGEVLHVDGGESAGHWTRRAACLFVRIELTREGTQPSST